MGVEDRDWYRDDVRRREQWQPSRAPWQGEQSRDDRSLGIATWIVVLAGTIGISVAAKNWKDHLREPPPPRPQAVILPAPINVLPQFPREPTPVRAAPPQTASVSRCVTNGQVSYSAGGGCRTGSETVVRVDSSPSEVEGGFSRYELEMLRSADARIQRNESASYAPVVPSALSASSRSSECIALDQHIGVLDARARMPLSAYEQDFIRRERSQATSRQYALRC